MSANNPSSTPTRLNVASPTLPPPVILLPQRGSSIDSPSSTIDSPHNHSSNVAAGGSTIFPKRSPSCPASPALDRIPSPAISITPSLPASHPSGPHHLNSQCARDDDTSGAWDDDEPDASAMGVSVEKTEDGVYQFSSSVDATVHRSRSKLNLSSSFTSSGPRLPPVALVLKPSGLLQPTPARAASGNAQHIALPYHRVMINYAPQVISTEQEDIARSILKCLELRTKFVWTPKRDANEFDIFDTPKYSPPDASNIPTKTQHGFRMETGVFKAWKGDDSTSSSSSSSSSSSCVVFPVPTRRDYGEAMSAVMDLALSGPVKSFTHNRLHILEARFNLHELLNHDMEQISQKSVPHRDFYNSRKIDNHVHHSACMNQKHLLRFIKYKLKKCPNEEVIIRNGQTLTLKQVFESLNMTAYDLSVDTLDMHADKTFHRFDKFNLKYNPVGESRLREIFLKYNNFVQGRYLAEITKQVFEDLESNKYQFAEYRVSIYGNKPSEWDALATWIVDNQLWSYNVRWMIQIPRLYSVYKAAGQIENFQQMLDNIFRPLFEVSVDPSSHPKLHEFLQQCVGFDIVDDESLREKPYQESMSTPDQWTIEYDPPYALFAYYVYANLLSLNQLRADKGFSTFSFRPHAGEAGDIEHLAACFIVAKSINHGLMLQKSPALQYLYYLSQIGISMSPLSNNLLFLEYDKNPFPRFFKKGLNVTLSTDDPLMIHVTREPLVEEYSVAAQVWKLSAIDMSEIARNSVLQSGFEHRFKAHFIGNRYWLRSLHGNDIRQTNVPDIRINFRNELLEDEYRMLGEAAKIVIDPSQLLDQIF